MIDPQTIGPKADTWIGGIMAAAGLAYVQSLGYLTPERVAEILG